MKQYFKKIAIFDLDDTLYRGNSHIQILNSYYHTKFFNSIFFKICAKLMPKKSLLFIWFLYKKIPTKFVDDFHMEFRKEVLEIFYTKKSNGYKMLVVSNAPHELIKKASKILAVDFICAERCKKLDAVKAQFHFEELFVCTDNKTDLDLLQVANEKIICCSKRNRRYFKKWLDNPEFLGED